MTNDGGGIYIPISPEIQMADGTFVTRPQEPYRKFEVVQRAVEEYHTVDQDTQERRNTLRQAMKQTTERLEGARSDAEAQKLKGIIAAQTSELATINAERSESFSRVLVLQAANQADQDRQRQADLETRAAQLQNAWTNVIRLFKTDSHPAPIPDPSAIAQKKI